MTIAEDVLTVSCFFAYRNNSKLSYRLFIVLGSYPTVWKYQEIRTIWGWNRQKIKRTAQNQPKVTGSYLFLKTVYTKGFFKRKSRTKWKRTAVISDIQDGGLRMVDIERMKKEQGITVVNKYLNNSPTGWKIFSSFTKRKIEGKKDKTFLLKSSIPYNSAESFSVQNILKIRSTVFNSCFRDHFPCYGIVVSYSNTHGYQFSQSNMKSTTVAKRQMGARAVTSLCVNNFVR